MTASDTIAADFPFESRFATVHGSRMHYVESGEGAPVLFLHGNPTSSYLWRNVIPHVAPHARCIAVDLIGMGKSDKPACPYRFHDHSWYVEGFIEAMGLTNLTLVVHDWGSALGFHYARRHTGNVRGLAFMEALLRPMRWSEFPKDFKSGFKLMRTPGVGWLMVSVMNVFLTQIMPQTIVRPLSAEERARYAEPFPTVGSRKPVRQWPREIPIDGTPRDVHEVIEAYGAWLTETATPKLLLHASPGGIIRADTVAWARQRFSNLETVDLGAGIHYVQEDHPHTIGAAIAEWYQRLPSPAAA
jgi:haloalkane dehalogenase